MTPPADHAAITVLAALASSAARALVVAGLVVAGLAALRVRRASWRLAAWTCVLWAALAMPALGWLLPAWRVPVPAPRAFAWLDRVAVGWSSAPSRAVDLRQISSPSGPDSFSGRSVAAPSAGVGDLASASTTAVMSRAPASVIASGGHAAVHSYAPHATPPTLGDGAPPGPGPVRSHGWRWNLIAILLAVYALGASVLGVRALVGWVAARRLVRAARAIDDPEITARLARAAAAIRLRRPPRLAESAAVFVPVTVSVMQPCVILPETWRTWEPATLDAVLIHELAHVARHDAVTVRATLIYRALQWFNPLAWWLARELANLAELASDEAVLTSGAEPAQYASMLLTFFSAIPSSGRRAEWGLAMAGGGAARAEARIERILAWAAAPASPTTRRLAFAAALVAAPIVVLTATIAPGAAHATPALVAAPALVVTPLPGPDGASVSLPRPPSVSGSSQAPSPPLGAITGVVTDVTTGAPVAGAVVVLEDNQPGSKVAVPAPQVTTPSGRFALLDLPPSPAYRLTATKTGFLDGGYGRIDPRGPAAPIALAAGQWLANVQVTLTRPGSISGTVVDERGQALVGAYVRALPQIMLAGRMQLLAGPAARTDDHGTYRLAGLGPGRYVVELPSIQATLPEGVAAVPQGGGANAATSSADLEAAKSDRLAERQVVDLGGGWRLVVGPYSLSPPPMLDGARQVYPITFYPNAPAPAEAVPIDLAVGESRASVDLRVQPARVARVSGVVQGPPEAIGNLSLRLMPVGLEELGQGSEAATTVTQKDGRFTFLDVPSGSYVLDASHMRVDFSYTATDGARTAVLVPIPFRAHTASSGAIKAAPPGVEYAALEDGVDATYWAQLRVSVSGQDVDGLVLMLRRPVTVSGQVTWAEGVTLPARVPPLVLEPADGRRSLGIPTSMHSEQPTDPPTFAFANAMAGQYFLRPMFGATVAAISWNGQDYTNRPLDTTSGADVTGVTVTLTTASSNVNGIVRDGAGPITSGAAILAFPVDKALWSNYGLDPPYLKSVLAATDGHFRIDGLPAGDYNLLAVPVSQAQAWLDPAYLASHVGVATSVHIEKADATVSNLSLRLVK